MGSFMEKDSGEVVEAKTCALCELKVFKGQSKLYLDAERWCIIECLHCNVPLLVWTAGHTPFPWESDRDLMEDDMHYVGEMVFGEDEYYFDMTYGENIEHCHWHIRKRKRFSKIKKGLGNFY